MNYFYQKKILITGGAGFIGSHLATTLVHLGAQVTILDNLSTGTRDNIASIASAVDFLEGDCTQQAILTNAMKNQDLVFHLAASTSISLTHRNPHACMLNNVLATAMVLDEAWRSLQKPPVIFSSSAAVYGAQEQACSETDPCNPLSVYGYSKYIGELLCKQYATLGLPTIALRYFNVVGERQSPLSVMSRFQKAIACNLALDIYGNGLQTRDFVPVDRVVLANLVAAYHAATTLKTDSLPLYDCYNVASGTSINLITLAKNLISNNPSFSAGIIHHPGNPEDIRHSQADCTKLEAMLQAYSTLLEEISEAKNEYHSPNRPNESKACLVFRN